MCVRGHRHSIYCIIPQYMMRSILSKGTEEQKAAASAAMAVDNTFRALRTKLAADQTLEFRRAHAVSTGRNRQRFIYTAGNTETLPGNPVRVEGAGPSGDAAVDEAYDGLGSTFDFFWEVYERNSIDDAGKPLHATVHYGLDYNNAFWNGRQMVFGDGDGLLFERFTRSLDVIGHELGHGVTEDEAGLVYLFQPGALNEHLSDVWGSLIKQWTLGQSADEADWLIGAELLGPRVDGKALRSMRDPGSAYDDPVLGKIPARAYVELRRYLAGPGRGPHRSGIPNRAFYLAAAAIGGRAWDKAGRVWYNTMRDGRITENTGFSEFARVNVDVASRLSGLTKAHVRAIADAWTAVGIS